MIRLIKNVSLSQYRKYIAINCAIFLTFAACTSPVPLQLDTQSVKFRTIKNIPVIEGRLNGKPAFFIVDTGASVSLLNESVSKQFGFRCIDSSGYTVAGLGGRQSSMHEAVNCQVELGMLKLQGVKFHAKHLGYVIRVISQNEDIQITGIIGANIIDHYKITINYKNRTISY